MYIRLVTGYENILAANGIDRYFFFVAPHQEQYMSMFKRAAGLDPYEIDDSGNYWYKKTIEKEAV